MSGSDPVVDLSGSKQTPLYACRCHATLRTGCLPLYGQGPVALQMRQVVLRRRMSIREQARVTHQQLVCFLLRPRHIDLNLTPITYELAPRTLGCRHRSPYKECSRPLTRRRSARHYHTDLFGSSWAAAAKTARHVCTPCHGEACAMTTRCQVHPDRTVARPITHRP